MVYQALAEYWINAKEQQYAMDIEIQVEGRSGLVPAPFRINNENAYQTRTTKVGIHWQIINCLHCLWQRMVKLWDANNHLCNIVVAHRLKMGTDGKFGEQ